MILLNKGGTMENKSLNWGIMGLGGIAHQFAENMNKTGEIYGVVSRDFDRTKQFQQEYNAKKTYESYEEMAKDPNIDIVYIATVNTEHYKNMKLCLENGSHVFCEKAIHDNYEEMKELERLAKKKNLKIFEAMTIFHMPLYDLIKNKIDAGKIGAVKMVKADFGSLKEADPTNRFFSKELGGGAMLDIGTYALSFLRYFMEKPIEDFQFISKKYPETKVDESWTIMMKDVDGVLGSSDITFRAKLPKKAIITGDLGYVEIDDYPRADKAVIHYSNGDVEEIQKGNTDDALKYEIENIEATLLDGKDLGHYDKTMDVVSWMDQCLKNY